MQKIRVFLITTCFIIALFFVYIYLASDNTKDNSVWNTIVSEELQLENVKYIRAGFSGEEKLVPESQLGLAIKEIRKSRFKKSNRIGYGPTAEKTIIVVLNDDSQLRFNYWGDKVFEHGRHIGSDYSQFLIENKALGIWLEKFSKTTR